jgi:hypothetical protein
MNKEIIVDFFALGFVTARFNVEWHVPIDKVLFDHFREIIAKKNSAIKNLDEVKILSYKLI